MDQRPGAREAANAPAEPAPEPPRSGVAEFLGARLGEDGAGTFELGQDMHGAFWGVFGGAVAAAGVLAARPAAAGRRPFSLHTTFVRGLATPTCAASVDVVNEGRTVSTVAVELTDERGKLAARSTVTFAAGEALSPQDHTGAIPTPEFTPLSEGRPVTMAGAGNPPVVDLMDPKLVGEVHGGIAHAVRIPWEVSPEDAAESACMAADFCVGLPVGSALTEFVPMPNPDLGLRFVGHDAGPVMVGIGRLARIDAGVAGTQVEVWTPDGSMLAIGLSSTVLMGEPR